MDKLNRILKNVVLFLIVFLVIQYVFSLFDNKEEELMLNSGNVIFTTTDTEYSRTQLVTVKIINNTEENIIIPNECPGEPFNVFRREQNEWVQKTVTPELNCETAEDTIIAPGKEHKTPYENWNHELFSEMGQFKIEFETEIEGEPITFPTNEFMIVKENILKQVWNGIFYRPIYNGLIFFAAVIPGNNLGLAIILLTILIRTILLIPSQKAMKSQKKMQEIQPRLEKIKEKHKGDQQKIAMETMAIWKEAKVNPMGSCLPILLQFPFLIALFWVIKGGLNPDNSFLLYHQYANFTLHDINIMFVGILDLTKENRLVLPLVVGGLQFGQMKLSMAKKTPKDKKEKGKKNEMAMATGTMMYIMPIMIAVFTASLPAGVGIYWGTSTLYGIIQQLVVNKSGPSTSSEPTVKVIKNKS